MNELKKIPDDETLKRSRKRLTEITGRDGLTKLTLTDKQRLELIRDDFEDKLRLVKFELKLREQDGRRKGLLFLKEKTDDPLPPSNSQLDW